MCPIILLSVVGDAAGEGTERRARQQRGNDCYGTLLGGNVSVLQARCFLERENRGDSDSETRRAAYVPRFHWSRSLSCVSTVHLGTYRLRTKQFLIQVKARESARGTSWYKYVEGGKSKGARRTLLLFGPRTVSHRQQHHHGPEGSDSDQEEALRGEATLRRPRCGSRASARCGAKGLSVDRRSCGETQPEGQERSESIGSK